MVCIREMKCLICQRRTTHYNGKCGICRDREEAMEQARWSHMTVEARLQELKTRVERLEAGPPTC